MRRMKRRYLVLLAVFTGLAVNVYGGILYLEVPEDVTAEMVRNPSAEDEAVIENFVISEVNKVDKGWADRVVILTKEGEPLYRENESDYTADTRDDQELYYGEIELLRGADWSNEQWKDIEGHFASSYPIAKDIFSPPVVDEVHHYWGLPRVVEVIRLQGLENDWGFYDLSNDIIYLKQWRGTNDVYGDTDRAMLTRCMLHAFRHGAPITWDQFGAGIVHSAWLEIQKRLAENHGKETNFNDLYHDEKLPGDPVYQRPFYAYRETFNKPEFATRMADFFDTSHSDIDTNIMKIRYGTCGYLWWQVLKSDSDFIKNFNDELLKTWNQLLEEDEDNRPLYGDLIKCADLAYDGDGINGKNIVTWIKQQPILNNDFYMGHYLGVGNYDNELKIAFYERWGHWEGVGMPPTYVWVEEESGVDGGYIVVDRYDYADNYINTVPLTTTNGYAECTLPFVGIQGNPQRNKTVVKALVDANKAEPTIKESTVRVLDAEYPLSSEVYGVIVDVDEGTMTLDRSEGEDIITPLRYGAYIFSQSGPGGEQEGKFTLTCEAEPRMGAVIKSPIPRVFTKDASRFYVGGNYFHDELTSDNNGNGIPDDDERLLAEKFVPEVWVSGINPLFPCRTEVTLDHGWLAHYMFDINGDLWMIRDWGPYDPEDPKPMEQVFEEIRPDWNRYPHGVKNIYEGPGGPEVVTHYWRLCFGVQGPGGKDIKTGYWYNQWETIQRPDPPEGNPYREPTVYVNIFGHHGYPVIQYWFFYPFNDWANLHEGDWEHINVKIDDVDPAVAKVDEVRYFFHKYSKTKEPGDINFELIEDTDIGRFTHPAVYIGGDPVGARIDQRREAADLISENVDECSGGSYWNTGLFDWVAFSYNEDVDPFGAHVPWGEFCINFVDELDELYWTDFPGEWGRRGDELSLNDGAYKSDGPCGPRFHECYEAYTHASYPEYSGEPRGGGLITGLPPAPPTNLAAGSNTRGKTGSVDLTWTLSINDPEYWNRFTVEPTPVASPGSSAAEVSAPSDASTAVLSSGALSSATSAVPTEKAAGDKMKDNIVSAGPSTIGSPDGGSSEPASIVRPDELDVEEYWVIVHYYPGGAEGRTEEYLAGGPGTDKFTIPNIPAGAVADYSFSVYCKDAVYDSEITGPCAATATAIIAKDDGAASMFTSGAVPTAYALYQSVPNPNDGSCSIRYDLPESCRVKMIVYDLTGRRVKTVLDTYMDAGAYTCSVSDLEAGVYVYRLEAGGFVASKKMVVIK
jgi:hypothetical protein